MHWIQSREQSDRDCIKCTCSRQRTDCELIFSFASFPVVFFTLEVRMVLYDILVQNLEHFYNNGFNCHVLWVFL